MAFLVTWTMACAQPEKLLVAHCSPCCGRGPRSYVQQPLSGDTDEFEGDLFCGVTSRAKQKDVVLRLETANAAEAKIRKSVSSLFVVLGYSALIALIVVKSIKWKSEPYELMQDSTWEIANLCISATCCLPVAGRTGIFLHRVYRTVQEGQHWAPRRKRMATLAFANSAVQVVNVFCWMLPHLIVVSSFAQSPPSCVWFSKAIDALAIIRWTCWNTTFLIYTVMGQSLMLWPPNQGWKTKLGCRQPMHRTGALVMDAPWSYHKRKLILWGLFEVFVILLVVPIYQPRPGPKTEGEQNCMRWTWENACKLSPTTRWPAISISCLAGVYSTWYTHCIVKVFRQAHMQLFRDTRAVRVLCHLQAHSVALAFHCMFFSLNALWFSNSFSCWSYMSTWLGLLPMQLVAAAVAWENAWLFMPKVPDEDPLVQVWLQEYAWTEASQPEKMHERNSHAQTEAEQALLAQQPMFCFETALKLHVWSCLVYTEVGQGISKGELQGVMRRHSLSDAHSDGSGDSNLVKAQYHASPEPSELWCEDSPTKGDSFTHWDVDGLDEEMGSESSPCTPTSPARTSTDDSAPDPFAPFKWGMFRRGDTDYNLRASTSYSESVLEAPAQQGMTAQPHPSKGKETRRARGERLLRTAMGHFGLTDLETFWDRQLDTKALLGWNAQTVVLAFRGTASMRNACSDMKVWRMAHEPIRGAFWLGTRPMVHTGFYQAWNAHGLKQQVMSHLKRLVDESQVRPDARICITGHSLGGALAQLAAHDIAMQLRGCRMQVYTFGCPYPGNHAFAREYDTLIQDTWNVAEEHDPVVRAGKFISLFKRPGHRVVISQRGEIVVRPNALELQIKAGLRITHHPTLAYRSAMLAICLAQFSICGVKGGRAGVLGLGDTRCMREDLQRDGLDFHQLRRIARWGTVHSSRVAPPTVAELKRLMSGKQAWAPKQAEGPWVREPRVTLAALQRYREGLAEAQEEEEEAGALEAAEQGSSSGRPPAPF